MNYRDIPSSPTVIGLLQRQKKDGQDTDCEQQTWTSRTFKWPLYPISIKSPFSDSAAYQSKLICVSNWGNYLTHSWKFEAVDHIHGSTISSNFSLHREIGKRIGKAATTFVRLTTRVWENSKFSVKTKIAMYNACIISKLLYRSETWTTHAMQEKRLVSGWHLNVTTSRILRCSLYFSMVIVDVFSL